MCQGDEQCIAVMDLLVAVDASGSLRETGYKILKEFAAAVVRRFENEAFGREAVLVGAIQFGDGKVLKDNIISPAEAIAQLTLDSSKVADAIKATEWQKGFTNLAQVFTKADEMSQLGRKHAPTTILVLTDGKPSFEYSLMQEVNNIKAKGVKIIMIELNPTLTSADKSLVMKLASDPPEANYLHIKGLKKLSREMDKWVQQVVVQSCPRALSPTKFAADTEGQGYELVREGQWCGDITEKVTITEKDAGGEIGTGAPHMYLGTFQEPADCMAAVMEMEGLFFSFGYEENFNKGKCFMELGQKGEWEPTTKVEDETCTAEGGWQQAPVNFYKIRPLKVMGEEGPPKKF